MTLDEAIDFGKMWLELQEDSKGSNTYEFFKIATQILEQLTCNDCISRQAALDLFKFTNTKGDVWYGIKGLPSVIPKGKTDWISVSSAYHPEDFQRVLVTIVNYNEDKVVRVAEYDNRNKIFQIKENCEKWKVGEKGLLAWMPLPEPYESESEEKE